MLPMPWTFGELRSRGYDVRTFSFAMHDAFTEAETAPIRVIERFWNEFVKAHAIIHRSGTNERMVA